MAGNFWNLWHASKIVAGCVMGNHATGLGIVGSPAGNAVRITCRPREFIILARENGTLEMSYGKIWVRMGKKLGTENLLNIGHI